MVPSFCIANTSATPVGLGTAGMMLVTPDPSPGLDQSTVPRASGPADTVTSAEAPPAVIVMCPTASAVRIGGSSVDKLTTVGSLDVQVSPATDCPAAFSAWIVCVSPTAMLISTGASIAALPPPPVTENASALLPAPFC